MKDRLDIDRARRRRVMPVRGRSVPPGRRLEAKDMRPRARGNSGEGVMATGIGDADRAVVGPLLPLMAAVFVVYRVAGAALPVLPLQLHET